MSIFLLSSLSAAFRPPSIAEELGCSPTLSTLIKKEFFFDPLQIAKDENFAYLREAELKHGRVSMLAVTELMFRPFIDQGSLEWHYKGLLKSMKVVERLDVVKVLLTCGILELFVLVQRDAQAMPGDYGTGYFGVRDKGLHERELVVELENGRLAMMALLIQLGLEFDHGEWLQELQKWASEPLLS